MRLGRGQVGTRYLRLPARLGRRRSRVVTGDGYGVVLARGNAVLLVGLEFHTFWVPQGRTEQLRRWRWKRPLRLPFRCLARGRDLDEELRQGRQRTGVRVDIPGQEMTPLLLALLLSPATHACQPANERKSPWRNGPGKRRPQELLGAQMGRYEAFGGVAGRWPDYTS